MSVLDIRVLGDPILRRETEPVAEITGEIRELVRDMFDTMYAGEGLGLAAPQVGRTERITVMEVEGTRLVLINPEVTAAEGSSRADEGCLSIPEVYGQVERAATVRVKALDEHGQPVELDATELLARCIQHEVDHLHGKLFIDHLSLLKRRSALAQWEKLKSEYPGLIRKVGLERSSSHRESGEF